MKLSLRLLGLSLVFLAQVPGASARFVDDFVFPSQSSTSSASSIQTSSVSSMESRSVSSSSASADFRVKIVPQPKPTREQQQAMEAVLPETRAGFVSMIVHRLYNQTTIDTCYWDIASELPPSFTLVFTDVPTDHPYAHEICVAMRDGIIRGYGDGSFRPNEKVTFGEAAKMISRAYGLHPWPDVAVLSSNPWFDFYVQTLEENGAIPSSVKSFDQRMSRDTMASILDRLDGHSTSTDKTTLSDLRKDWESRYKRPQPVSRPAATGSASSKAASKTSSSKAASQAASSEKSYPAWIY